MLIRPETPADVPAIDQVVESAFASVSHTNHAESAILRALRADNDLILSLVAETGRTLVGHIAFSPVRVDGHPANLVGLGPLAVRPAYQQMGVGTALVERGLKELRGRNAAGCVVLGDPAFYKRFGFESDARLRYGDLPVRLIQRLVFDGEPPAGELQYAPAFDLAAP